MAAYGGPDADGPGEPSEPFDNLDLDTAPALVGDRRRHTIATTRPQVTFLEMMQPRHDFLLRTAHAIASNLEHIHLHGSVVLTLSLNEVITTSSALTIVAVQGREFAWLRPNEVVARPTSASGGRGLDYLWLRSRVVVKLSPEIRSRVARCSSAGWTLQAHTASSRVVPANMPTQRVTCSKSSTCAALRSSTMKRLSQDTSFRSPMGVLRDIDFASRGSGAAAGGMAAAVEECPATPMSSGAAAARRASRRLTLG